MKKRLLILCLITLFAGLLRFTFLAKFPVSLDWDEASHGYNAYSILTTGKDEWGKFFPLIFKAFGDYKLPVYIYSTVIPIFLFGLNTFSVRFISALAGTLAIPGIYFLYRKLFPKQPELYGYLAAFFLAVCPWHFFISRPALEANLALTFIIYGTLFLLKGLDSPKHYLLSALFFGLSLHTYNTARVFVPLFLLAFLFIKRHKIRIGKFSLSASFLLLSFLVLVVFQVFSGEGTARYGKLKILSESAVFQIGNNRTQSKLPPLISKIIYNRPVYFTTTFIKNYLGYFTPQFISQTSGAQTQFAIPNHNLFGWVIVILALLGLFVSKNPLVISWLFLSPVAAALTADPPQALRPNPLIPAVIILGVSGLYFICTKLSPKISSLLTSIVILLVSLTFCLYLNDYYSSYQVRYSQSWQYGYSQVIDYINKHSSSYTNIFITKRYGEPHIFYAFYSHLNPVLIQPGKDNIRFEKSDWFWTDKIGNVHFVNDWQIPTKEATSLTLESGGKIPTVGSLLVTSPDHIPANAKVLETVNFLDKTPAFIITEIR
jgi:4-amino-4-deoxy-L-arabinose transferase-like glycosyltransferase